MYIEKIIYAFEDTEREIEYRASTDLISYESQLDSNRDAFQGISDIVESVSVHLLKNRISKEFISGRMKEIEKTITNQI